MNDLDPSYDTSSTSAPSSCCVWPLTLVLSSLLIVNSVQLISIVQERSAVKQVSENATKAVARYKLVSDKLENLAKDLMRLSLTNSEAKEIVTQFNIQMNQPGVPPVTPAK